MTARRISPWLLLALAPPVLALCLLAGTSKLGVPDGNILRMRFDRVSNAFVVGAALASAGAVFQALLRNPLAEPYLLGVSSGAGLGAGLYLLLLAPLGVLGGSGLPACAFAMACLTLALVYALAASGGRLSIYSLILSGVIVSAVCSSLLMFLVTTSDREGMHSVVWWMLGNLEIYDRPMLAASAAVIGAGFLAAWLMAPELNALTLGADLAHYVGVRTRLAVTLGLLVATLITATAVSTSGLIGFVGLIVPHAARHLVGPDHRRLLPACALLGGAFLAVCDAFAWTILAPLPIPVGVITALVGGPFFLVILRRRRRSGWVE